MKENQLFSIIKYFHILMKTSFVLVAALILLSMLTTNRTSDRIVQESLDEANSQISILIDSTFSRIRSTAQYISFSNTTAEYLLCEDDFQLITNKSHLDNVIRPLAETDPHLFNIILYRESKRIPYFAKIQTNDMSLFYNISSVFEDENHENQGFITLSQNENPGIYYPAYVTKIAKTGYGKDTGTFIGSLVIAMKPDFLNQVLRSVSSKNISSVLIVDQNDTIIAQSGSAGNIDWRNDANTYSQDIANTDWKLVCIMNRAVINQTFYSFFIVLLFLSMLFVLILVAVYLLLSRNITGPISSLCQEIVAITPMDGSQRITSCNVLEINNIVESINWLLGQRQINTQKIIELRNQQYEIELSKRASDLMALKIQVNPHFLFNTFTCIGGLALLHNVPEITVIIANMSEICRYSLSESDQVTIRQEVGIIQKYLEIVDIRFHKAYQFHIHVEDILWDCDIPKMVLQPLVENALYHGLEGKKHGEISISGNLHDNQVVFTIQDTGVGIPTDELQMQQALLKDATKLEYSSVVEGKVGNVNLCRRIKLLYGEEFGLEIDSRSGQGTTASLMLPYNSNVQSY